MIPDSRKRGTDYIEIDDILEPGKKRMKVMIAETTTGEEKGTGTVEEPKLDLKAGLADQSRRAQ